MGEIVNFLALDMLDRAAPDRLPVDGLWIQLRPDFQDECMVAELCLLYQPVHLVLGRGYRPLVV